LRELGAKWLVQMADYILNNPSFIVQGFHCSGISKAQDGIDSEDNTDPEYCDSSEESSDEDTSEDETISDKDAPDDEDSSDDEDSVVLISSSDKEM